MIDVQENEDGSFTISWDENDPSESIFNTWTDQDFINCLMSYCKKVLSETDDVSISTEPSDKSN